MQIPLTAYDTDYSIVISTYNPDERLLKRCLNAIYNLDTDGITAEVILVDNSSLIPLDGLAFVREFIRKMPSVKIIVVAVQGVNYARMAAVSEAKGKYIIYFDYDNEPESNYLQELKKLNTKYPQVAAIGPGHISVDFIDGIEKSIESYAYMAFQERHEEAIKFSRVCEWDSCYPSGTGLCTSALLLKEYINLTKQGRFTMPGKIGQELCSGEDTQMVMYCISKGYFAGVSPTLLLKHNIPKTRANDKYLQRLVYRAGICYASCLAQVFPKHENKLKQEIISVPKFSVRALKKFIKARWGSDPHKVFDLVQFISLNAGAYLAIHKPVPALIKRIIKQLKLE